MVRKFLIVTMVLAGIAALAIPFAFLSDAGRSFAPAPPLDAPVNVRRVIVGNLLAWNAVDSDGTNVVYQIYVNGETRGEWRTEPNQTQFRIGDLDLRQGEWQLQVRALGDRLFFMDSELSAAYVFTQNVV